jgi:hypothetical protein
MRSSAQGPALPAAPLGGSASHQQLFFFFYPASRSRMSDANEKTAKMHQEVSSPFPFLLATGTVDFSFWPCLDADSALPIWHYALHSTFCF